MKHVHGTHAIRRRISQHLLMQQPLLYDVLCELIMKLFEGLKARGFPKCCDLQDSDQQPIQRQPILRHEGANPAKKPCEQSRCKKLPFPMLAKA
jgi:hypothetical protein